MDLSDIVDRSFAQATGVVGVASQPTQLATYRLVQAIAVGLRLVRIMGEVDRRLISEARADRHHTQASADRDQRPTPALVGRGQPRIRAWMDPVEAHAAASEALDLLARSVVAARAHTHLRAAALARIIRVRFKRAALCVLRV